MNSSTTGVTPAASGMPGGPRRPLRKVAVAGALLAAVVTASACSAGGDASSASTSVPGDVAVSPTVRFPAPAPASVTSPDPATDPATGTAADGAAPPAGAGDSGDVAAALATLDTLPVKGRAPKTGYSREQFGQEWADVDRNGCDTRNDILARDLTGVTLKEGSCRVLSGTLDDPYTGRAIGFVRGQDTSSAVQIDHVVALSDAWQKGAQQLTPERREQFANDPANLLAVDGPANQQKSDGDAATWLPANKAFRCTYVSKQIGVKATYALWVTPAEKDAMVRVLSACGGTGTGTVGGTTTGTGDVTGTGGAPVGDVAEVPPAPAAPSPESVPVDPAGVYYANCAAARAAGAAPLHRGEPGYRSGMDGDDDGTACE
ncbi:GmrSD restriction endonuclease domain-containing protein [Corynebacterium neomassiliense]|uniref:GmrSD restriction endonuclease domain-containing protein n=1 Tax=Corynebacterium neomassiliense TaxID=2079482 RepID=UPI001F21255A|nr:DUF1524 domain-containing protein [Corynebacterium neomassiliense]